MPYANTPDVNIYYEVHGEGYPVIFIHGGGGNSMAFFQQVPFFSKQYKVITVDLRGFKNSACAPANCHTRHFVDDIRAVMQTEGLSEAAFCCQSMGAWAGLRLALQSPEMVSCLFVNGSPTPAYSPTNWAVIHRANPIFQKGAERGAGIGWNRKTLIDNPNLIFFYSQIKQLNNQQTASLVVQSMDTDVIKIHPVDFEGYTTPTVIAGGSHDDFLNPESHFHAASLIPGAQAHTFADAGHSAYFETPEEFNRVLDAFLKQHLRVA